MGSLAFRARQVRVESSFRGWVAGKCSLEEVALFSQLPVLSHMVSDRSIYRETERGRRSKALRFTCAARQGPVQDVASRRDKPSCV